MRSVVSLYISLAQHATKNVLHERFRADEYLCRLTTRRKNPCFSNHINLLAEAQGMFCQHLHCSPPDSSLKTGVQRQRTPSGTFVRKCKNSVRHLKHFISLS
ncbi:hypothetical protein CDAR_116181 [Caerostris darwini]|uniref:Secreted protein n=1 Tax=Caerostris darwini TaxID=1538125 RepID=A0AAV4SGP4_9ARAC|nr:hypothetical protein CDAR_116181 [Caerostris darwini]